MYEIVPIFGIIFGVGGPIAIIAFIVIYLYKARQLRSQEIIAAMEKGIEVPFPPPKEPRKRNYLNLGIVWTLVGTVIAVAMGLSTGSAIGLTWGLLPVAVGIAFLLIALIERKKKASEGEDA